MCSNNDNTLKTLWLVIVGLRGTTQLQHLETHGAHAHRLVQPELEDGHVTARALGAQQTSAMAAEGEQHDIKHDDGFTLGYGGLTLSSV